MKVLLVEDNPNDVTIIKRILNRNYKELSIDWVKDGKEYLEKLSMDYDIILSDYSMPTFNGMEALKIRNSKFPLIPFIIVTGSENENTAVDCMRAGADNYILKDHLDRLIPAIKIALTNALAQKRKEEIEEELLVIKKNYTSLIENSDLAFIIEDADQNFIYVNEKATKIFGYSKSAFLSIKYKDIVHSESLDIVHLKRHERSVKRLKKQDYQISGIKADGTKIYLDIHAEPNMWEGDQNGYLYYIKDISSIKSEQLIKEAINQISKAALVHDDMGKFAESVSSIVYSLLNIDNFFVILYHSDSKMFEFIYLKDNQRIPPNRLMDLSGGLVDFVFQNKESLLLDQDSFDPFFHKNKLTRLGPDSKAWIGVPLIHYDNVIGVMGCQDYDGKFDFNENTLKFMESISIYISMKLDREIAHRKNLENEAKFKKLFESSPTAIIIHQNAKVVMANTLAMKLAAISKKEDMIGKNVAEFILKEDLPMMQQRMKKVLVDKIAAPPLIEKFVNVKGEIVLVETISVPYIHDGKPAAQVLMRDVTELMQTKSLLEQSEEKFRVIFKTSIDPITITDIDTGVYYEVNHAFEAITGYSSEEVIGKSAKDIGIWKSLQEREEIFDLLKKHEIVKNHPSQFVMKNGEIQEGLVSVRYIRFGDKLFAMMMVRIVTEMVLAQRKMQESQEKLNIILNSASDPIILYDYDPANPKNLLINDWNQACLNLYGYTAEELQGKPASFLIQKEQLSTMPNNLTQIASGKSLIFESVHIKKTGESFPIEISAKKIQIGDQEYILAMERDITQRKLAEVKISNSEAKFKAAFENSPDAMVILNLNTRKAIDVNNGFVELTGYTFNDLKGRKFANQIFTGFNKEKSLKKLLSSEHNIINEEVELFHRNGQIKVVLTSASKIFLHDIAHLLVIARDITDIKKLQDDLLKAKNKAEESDRLKSAFLANMSHEIRTPMNHIIGFTEFIRQGVTEDELKKYINIIQKSGKHLLALLNDIIDISKIESGQFKLLPEKVRILPLIKDIFKQFSLDDRIAKNDELTLINEVGFNENFQVMADPMRLNQILINLISNSLKYTHAGFIKVGVFKDSPDFLTFIVEDTGVGINKKDQKFIFDRFRQVEKIDGKVNEGTGIGLALSKAFVEMMGGKIWVESDGKSGTKFLFTIPLYYNKSEVFLKQLSEGKISKIQDKNVLIVEDDPNSLLLLKAFTSKVVAKENIDVCKDGKMVFEKLVSKAYDLVLLDIKLPHASGLDIIKRLRIKYPNLSVIAQSAYYNNEDESRLKELGFSALLPKPFTKQEVLEKILELL